MAAPAEVSKKCSSFRIRQFKEKCHYNTATNLMFNTMVSFIIRLIARTARIACMDRQTDRDTHTHTHTHTQTRARACETTTVTLAAHARRRLIMLVIPIMYSCKCRTSYAVLFCFLLCVFLSLCWTLVFSTDQSAATT